MIFYFTGTGNSFYAAQQVQKATKETLIDIGSTVKSRQFTYEIQPGERVGFVFPVYFYGIPNIVTWFIKKLVLTGYNPDYVYALITCGGSIGGSDQMLREELDKVGLELNAVFSLKMPDNYVIMYDVPNEEKQTSILEAADKELPLICESIVNCSLNGYVSSLKDRMMTRVLYPFYIHGRSTKKFWVDDQCIGCGACASRCACNAIQMTDGHPTWVKDRCIHCLGCTNRCGAIQYGKNTVKRGRYKHPVFAKKKSGHGNHH